MISSWNGLKEEACRLRKRGLSLRVIHKNLGIPGSTLSGWFKDIRLSDNQLQKLRASWKAGLVLARKRAVVWHNNQKETNLREAKERAENTLLQVDTSDRAVLDIALAMLYLGEGFKKSTETGIGNSDPLVLRFFLAVLKRNYNFDLTTIRCELHLRADQDSESIKQYWSMSLGLPLSSFKYVVKDKRTEGSATYSHYKGVCLLRCANVAIQRKLVYLSQKFCEKVIKESRA